MASIQKVIINSLFDNLPLSMIYSEAENPIGILQCCHGMTEHKDRYHHFIKYMADNGLHCCMHDMRGHGESVLSPDDLGYFYSDGKSGCIYDILTINRYLHEKYPKLPVFLLGHSMGSLEVRTYCKSYDDTISGLIICGSPSPVKGAFLGKPLIKLLTMLHGERHRSGFINNIVLGAYNKPYKKESASRNNWISTDKENVRNYDSDPLCGFTFTLNGFRTLLDFMQETYSSKGWRVSNPKLPVFFISGADDPCRGSDEDFKNALAAMNRAGYVHIDYKLYPKARHELLNETLRNDVMKDILDKLKMWV